MAESSLYGRLMERASAIGHRLWRNNVGSLSDRNGRPVRFGLCPGSGDLIGFTVVRVTPAMVGRDVAVFTSVEGKALTGRMRQGQEDWASMVRAHGGIAIVARSVEDYEREVLCGQS